MNRRLFLRFGGAAALATLGACAATPTAPVQPTAAPVRRGVFYPPPPSPPRLQYLATYASEADIAGRSSDFATFIVGEAQAGQHLQQPYGVEMHDGRIYVVDTAVAGIVVFDLAAHRLTTLLGSGGGAMQRPINVTIDSDGTRYVCDTGRDQVLVFDADDAFVTAFGTAGQFRPVDCAIHGERLYVVDIAHHRVQVLDKHRGEVLAEFGKAGSAPGELFHPTNLAIGPTGDVFVVETSNFRVQRFSPDGVSMRTYGSIGDGPGHFARPKGIAIDRAGRLYVGDAAFENVQVFDDAGQLLLAFGTPSGDFAGLNLPAGLSISYEDTALFAARTASGFDLEYLVLVSSQFGPNKVDVFGFGQQHGADYSLPELSAPLAPPPPAASPLRRIDDGAATP